MDTILPGLRAYAPNENSNQCDSDYKSDPMLEIADCYAASNDPGDMQHDSDENVTNLTKQGRFHMTNSY